jgi:processing peptidase subunit beta
LRLRGTQKSSRGELEKSFNSIGAKVTQEICRERNSMYITCHKDNVDKAIKSVGDILTNSTFNENQLEAEREGIYRRIVDLQKDMMECTLENAFYTSFRDHQMGQPTLGNRDNVANITPEKIREFVNRYHTGKNLVITATGNVDHGRIVDSVNREFKGLNSTSGDSARENNHKPMFTPSIIFTRDDEMVNLNASVMFRAPSYSHPDSHLMRLFVELLGEYRADLHTGTNLNDPGKQYNYLHERYGHMPGIHLQKTFYFPFSDVGLFGTYVNGSEVFGPQICFLAQTNLSNYAHAVGHILTVGQPV